MLGELREKEPHGNRSLFLDDVFVASLLAFFNPTLRTLRAIEDFSRTRRAQKHLSIPKLCKSTFSDFNKLAQPERLRPILDHLRREALKPGPGQPRLADPLVDLHRKILAVDGTFLKAAATVAWAIRRRGSKTGARLDFHLDVETWLPELIVIPEHGEGEAATALPAIHAGAIHIYDRGIFSFELIEAHDSKAADLVMRVREPGDRVPKLIEIETRPLTQADRDAGIVSDRTVRLAGSQHAPAPAAALREVVILPADPSRGGPSADDDDGCRGVDHRACFYRNRWQVELFFRWVKSYARFDHLISHTREGVLLNFYVAVIGVTLLDLQSGHRPSKHLFSLMGMVASGSASLEEIMPILRERERRIQLERDRLERKRAEKLK